MKFIVVSGLLMATSFSYSQTYEFETVKDLSCTEVKSQDMTGTCWSYSTTSFLESEFIRMGKGSIDLSEMYNVRMVYPEKAMNYVRYHGKTQFGQGSLSHDVINSAAKYGLVPESVYSGKNNGEDKHNHDELEKMLKSSLEVVLGQRTVSNTWMSAYNAILDSYLGPIPTKFKYKKKEYTPESFAKHLGFNADDYVSIASFTHHPFYEEFILEVPDNFSNGTYENVPLDEFMKVIDHALENGFTLAWDADVSESTFSRKTGMAIIPEKKQKDMSQEEKDRLFKEIIPEKNVTQEMRQKGFEDHTTTDDHLMHIVGKLKDQKGNVFYKVKNSWGKKNGIDGYMYVSVPYMKMKSIAVLLHKDGIPKDIAEKIGQ